MKEKILSDIGLLIDFYKSNGKSIRSLIHMKHWIDAGYELKRINYIENCLQLLVEIDYHNKLNKSPLNNM